MQCIGLIGGMSWESTAVYYRRLNEQTRERLGGLHSADVIMHSVDFAEIVALQKAAKWAEAAQVLGLVAQGLQKAGANIVLICTNTMHLLADEVQAAVDIPLLHIADVTAKAVKEGGSRRPLLLATRYTMEQAFYRDRLRERHGLDALVPAEASDRNSIHDIIFDELCRGVVKESSRQRYLEVIESGRRAGADSVILGCTEIGLLIGPEDVSLPVYDSTLLHADAALDFALAAQAA
ncbi:MAG: aspartate/glutamate racemase family protein [Zavarzinia sp.]|nr:aspartate/glutamate racemase family protein [Zavarzinia sp.]